MVKVLKYPRQGVIPTPYPALIIMKALTQFFFGIKFASSSMIRGQFSQGKRDYNKVDFFKG